MTGTLGSLVLFAKQESMTWISDENITKVCDKGLLMNNWYRVQQFPINYEEKCRASTSVNADHVCKAAVAYEHPAACVDTSSSYLTASLSQIVMDSLAVV